MIGLIIVDVLMEAVAMRRKERVITSIVPCVPLGRRHHLHIMCRRIKRASVWSKQGKKYLNVLLKKATVANNLYQETQAGALHIKPQ